MMRSLRITRVESHRLSDGRLAEISKLGRRYHVMLTSREWLVGPELWSDLCREDGC